MPKKSSKNPPVRRLAGPIDRNCIAPSPEDPKKPCGKPFKAKNAKGVYCSPECKARAHYQKTKKEAESSKKAAPARKSNPGSKKLVGPVKKVASMTKIKPKSGTITIITTPSPLPVKMAGNMDYLASRRKLKGG